MRKKRARNNKMAEVARRAGVSLSTVSRALAGSPLISAGTRKLVRSVAARLDYRVDAAGSSLRTGLTRTAGVVIPLTHAETQHLSDPFFLEVPTDCAVAGYDDIPFASLMTPPLTTVRQNCREGAKQLVDGLMRAINHERPSSAVLSTEIIVRASSQRQRYRKLPSIRAKRASGSVRSRHGRRDGAAARS